MDVKKYKVRLMPQGDVFYAAEGQTLLEALVESGIFLRSDCGGKGICGKCFLKIVDPDPNEFRPPSAAEKKLLGENALAAGYRLACSLEIQTDISVEIPKEAFVSPEVVQKPPLSKKLQAGFSFEKEALNRTSDFGLAVDLGTTTIAIYLCDLAGGKVVASISVKNPQALFGEDVISRINAVAVDRSLLRRLQTLSVRAIEWGAVSLLKAHQIADDHLRKIVVVGNTTMIHLFLAENPTSLGVFPYEPLFVEEKTVKAGVLHFRFNSSVSVLTLPLISGFLGSDIVSAAMAVEMKQAQNGTMLIDVGTNGELMLRSNHEFLGTSCATGPAFEGATLSHGMPAVSGAIDAVRIDPDGNQVFCSLIQNDPERPKKAAGICGSGVVSAVAELLRAQIITESGRFNSEAQHPCLNQDEEGSLEFVLVPSEETEMNRPITLTQKDIRAVQLAKGALITGSELLCRAAGLDQPEKLLVAGGFGNYLNTKDAQTIGMFPKLSDNDIAVVGNAAGEGAILALLDSNYRKLAKELAESTRVIDLAANPFFQETFLKSLNYPQI